MHDIWNILHKKCTIRLGLFVICIVCIHQVYFSMQNDVPQSDKDHVDANLKRIFHGADLKKGPQNQLSGTTVVGKPRPCSAYLPNDQRSIQEQFYVDPHWKWIAQRAKQNWPYLQDAMMKLQRGRHREEFNNRTCLNIIILAGFLTRTNFAVKAFEGGPLGELLQWADLISALHALGHRISVRYDIRYTGLDLRGLHAGSNNTEGCSSDEVDFIFTDLAGHIDMPSDVTQNFQHKMMLVDVYGTEVMYNNADYAQSHGLARSAGMRNLNTKHIFTMYPETVDNSFLGFMVHPHTQNVTKEEIAILYGKEPSYLQGKADFLKLLRQFIEIHATLPSHPVLREIPGLINHGLMSSEKYQKIAAKSKYFIGVGDPIEGPGMLEALARGCIIIQPKFTPPRSLHNLGKPSNRSLTSQAPYLERIGPPHVFTVSYNNMTEVMDVLKKIIDLKVEPLLPYEFTPEGYIYRLHNTLTKLNQCNKRSHSVQTASGTSDTLKPVVAQKADLSCAKVCQIAGMVCDTTRFPAINSTDLLKSFTNCSNISVINDVYAPALHNGSCVLQGNKQLYSCNSYSLDHIYRVCPCVNCDETNSHFCDVI